MRQSANSNLEHVLLRIVLCITTVSARRSFGSGVLPGAYLREKDAALAYVLSQHGCMGKAEIAAVHDQYMDTAPLKTN